MIGRYYMREGRYGKNVYQIAFHQDGVYSNDYRVKWLEGDYSVFGKHIIEGDKEITEDEFKMFAIKRNLKR